VLASPEAAQTRAIVDGRGCARGIALTFGL
jgi:hypothetical protein